MAHSADALAPLLSDGILEAVISRLKTGKEAEIFLVQQQGEIYAAKVYKERNARNFRNNAAYKEGRVSRNSRTQRAMEKGSRFGQRASEDAWKAKELEALQKLHAAGVRVPQPVLLYEGVLVMEIVIDAEGHPAPRLIDAAIPTERAAEWYADLRQQAIRMLCCDLIHGDLSPYNVLLAWNGPTVIDFPQVIGAAHNSQAERFFRRDLETIHRFFAAIDPGLRAHAQDAREIWAAYQRRELTPDFVPTGRFEAPRAGPSGRGVQHGRGGAPRGDRTEFRQGGPRHAAQDSRWSREGGGNSRPRSDRPGGEHPPREYVPARQSRATTAGASHPPDSPPHGRPRHGDAGGRRDRQRAQGPRNEGHGQAVSRHPQPGPAPHQARHENAGNTQPQREHASHHARHENAGNMQPQREHAPHETRHESDGNAQSQRSHAPHQARHGSAANAQPPREHPRHHARRENAGNTQAQREHASDHARQDSAGNAQSQRSHAPHHARQDSAGNTQPQREHVPHQARQENAGTAPPREHVPQRHGRRHHAGSTPREPRATETSGQAQRADAGRSTPPAHDRGRSHGRRQGNRPSPPVVSYVSRPSRPDDKA